MSYAGVVKTGVWRKSKNWSLEGDILKNVKQGLKIVYAESSYEFSLVKLYAALLILLVM